METNLAGKEIVRRAFFQDGTVLTMVGTIIPGETNNTITYGWSVCSPTDTYSKKVGLKIARGRHDTNCNSLTVPVEASFTWKASVMGDLLKRSADRNDKRLITFGRILRRNPGEFYSEAMDDINPFSFKLASTPANATYGVVLTLGLLGANANAEGKHKAATAFYNALMSVVDGYADYFADNPRVLNSLNIAGTQLVADIKSGALG